jgi:hypothetical protein
MIGRPAQPILALHPRSTGVVTRDGRERNDLLRPGPDDVEHDDAALVDHVDDQAPVAKRPRVELGRVARDTLPLPGITTELLDRLGERPSASR